MMEQLAIFVENRPGYLRQVTKLLHEGDRKIYGISSVDTPEFGILRMIVDGPREAAGLLTAQGFAVKISDVIAVDTEEEQHTMDDLLAVCYESNINVNYIYSSFGRMDAHATFILCADDLEETESLLRSRGFRCL